MQSQRPNLGGLSALLHRLVAAGAAALCLLLTAPSASAKVGPGWIELPVVDRSDLRFSRLSTEDGLSQTRVTQIVQDDRGFLWFGTQFGLNRFDGYKFKVYVHDPQRADSLGGVYISALFKDREGKLWVGCSQSLDCLDPATERFTHYKIGSEASPELTGRVVHIFQDPEGLIWLASGTGLHRLDPATGQITHFRHDPKDPDSLASNDVKSAGLDRQGTFWVATTEGLDAFDRASGKVTSRIAIPDPLHLGFYEDRFGTFWIFRTSSSGLATYDRTTRQLTQYMLDPRTLGGGPMLTGVRAMLEDDRGELWLGTFGAGLLRYDRANQRFIRYRNNPADSESLADDNVVALAKDREGNIWAGLHASGPNHFSTRPPRFEQFRRDPSNPNGLASNFIDAFYEDHRGRLWIGTDDALLQLDRETAQYTRFATGLGIKPTIDSITEDHHGSIWIGTYRRGLGRLDETTGRFAFYRHHEGDPSTLSNDAIHCVFLDHNGRLWVGTNDGLNRFDPARNRFDVFKVDPENRWSQCYVTIAEDRQGILWLGSAYSGLHRFDPATGKFTVYQSKADQPGAVADDTVPAVFADDHGVIWVGTEIGLDKLDPSTGIFTPCLDNGAELGRSIGRILADRRGNLWMSTNKGITEYDPATAVFRHYSAADGLPGNDLTGWEAGCVGRDGRIYFGGFDGGVAFDPEKVSDDDFVPPLVLTDFRLPYAPKSSQTASLLNRGLYPADKLTLAHDENSIFVEFSALSYFNPKTNRYRYRLEGLDKRWNEVSSYQRSATYTTLPAGSYLFRAQGATARGDWSAPGIAFRIEVLRPWWATWWFRLIVVTVLIGLLIGGIRRRINQARRRERDFRTLADNAPDMVTRVGRDERILYANPAAANYLGGTNDSMRGSTLEALDQPDRGLPFSRESVIEALKTGAASVAESAVLTAQGKRHFEARLVPEKDDHGATKSVLAIVRDITEQKQSEESLQQTRDELARVARVTTMGELTASIAHEVNQPLAAIVTNGQACLRWLNRDIPDLPEIRTSLEQMVRDGIRGSEVVTRIRALVRKETPLRSPLEMNAVAQEIAEMMPLPAEGPTLQVELSPVGTWVIADRIQLQQVLLNLLRNALEATAAAKGAHSALILRTSRGEPGLVLVEVIDSGVGVAEEKMARLFEPFYTTKADGLGMGLSICRSIIESHGGKLWAEARAEGGMKFRFTLPVVPKPSS